MPQGVKGKTGTVANDILRDYAKQHGAKFDYSTRMVKLERKNGRVTGCVAQNSDGKYIRYIAKKGIVIATGGYARNYAMMQALQPWSLNILALNGGLPGATGDGIKACLWVGAKMDETHYSMQFDRAALRIDQKPGVETMKKGDVGLLWMASHPWLKVNADGERFINESGTYENPLHADEYNKGHCTTRSLTATGWSIRNNSRCRAAPASGPSRTALRTSIRPRSCGTSRSRNS